MKARVISNARILNKRRQRKLIHHFSMMQLFKCHAMLFILFFFLHHLLAFVLMDGFVLFCFVFILIRIIFVQNIFPHFHFVVLVSQ
jgi:hypothetical protein